MNNYPRINITIATYNRSDLLHRAVKSALDQTYPNLSVTVVDDGSEQDPRGSIEDLLEDRRLTYIRLENNVGAYAARNLSIFASEYDAITFHDSDDFTDPTLIMRQAEKIFDLPDKPARALPGIEICTTLTKTRYRDGVETIRGSAIHLASPFVFNIYDDTQYPYLRTVSSLFRKHIFEALGGFWDVKVSSDDDFRNRTVGYGFNFFVINEALYTQELQEDSLTVDESTNFKSEYRHEVVAELDVRLQEMKKHLRDKEYFSKNFSEEIGLKKIKIEYVVNPQNLSLNRTVRHQETEVPRITQELQLD